MNKSVKVKQSLTFQGRGFTTSVACGGLISDGTTRGSIRGCDDVVLPPSPPTTTTPAPVTTTTRRTTPQNNRPATRLV